MTNRPALTRLPGTPEPMHCWPGHGGIRIAGDSWGPADGPLVLLQHGGGQTRHAWKGAGETLGTAGYHAVAFDARGHGDTDWAPDGVYGQDVMVRDLQCVVAALGNRRPVLVGASMGGGTSLVAVGESHVDATALVLVDIAPRIEAQGVDRIVNFMRAHPEGFATLEDAALHIASYRGRPVAAHPRGLQKNLRLNAAGRWTWHWDQRLMNDENHNHRNDPAFFERALEQYAGPLMLVRGARSDVISPEGAEQFQQTFPQARFVALAGAGHMVAGDANDAFTATLIEFLREVMPPSTSASPGSPEPATTLSAANGERAP